jgi:superfamily II helicase
MRRYISRIGPIPDSDTDVADSYNNRIRDSAVSNYCITHQRFREIAANNITVAKQALECLQLANKGMTGDVKMVPENLARINVDERHIKSILRSASCVFAIIVKGKSAGEEVVD